MPKIIFNEVVKNTDNLKVVASNQDSKIEIKDSSGAQSFMPTKIKKLRKICPTFDIESPDHYKEKCLWKRENRLMQMRIKREKKIKKGGLELLQRESKMQRQYRKNKTAIVDEEQKLIRKQRQSMRAKKYNKTPYAKARKKYYEYLKRNKDKSHDQDYYDKLKELKDDLDTETEEHIKYKRELEKHQIKYLNEQSKHEKIDRRFTSDIPIPIDLSKKIKEKSKEKCDSDNSVNSFTNLQLLKPKLPTSAQPTEIITLKESEEPELASITVQQKSIDLELDSELDSESIDEMEIKEKQMMENPPCSTTDLVCYMPLSFLNVIASLFKYDTDESVDDNFSYKYITPLILTGLTFCKHSVSKEQMKKLLTVKKLTIKKICSILMLSPTQIKEPLDFLSVNNILDFLSLNNLNKITDLINKKTVPTIIPLSTSTKIPVLTSLSSQKTLSQSCSTKMSPKKILSTTIPSTVTSSTTIPSTVTSTTTLMPQTLLPFIPEALKLNVIKFAPLQSNLKPVKIRKYRKRSLTQRDDETEREYEKRILSNQRKRIKYHKNINKK